MDIHLLENNSIRYPVGKNILVNLPIIKEMAYMIESLFTNKDIMFWVSGTSGALISGIICSLISNETTIFQVRKKKEDSHDQGLLKEGDFINIIVDDFIVSGETVLRILKEMNSYGKNPDCLCVSGEYCKKNFRDVNFKFVICNEELG